MHVLLAKAGGVFARRSSYLPTDLHIELPVFSAGIGPKFRHCRGGVPSSLSGAIEKLFAGVGWDGISKGRV